MTQTSKRSKSILTGIVFLLLTPTALWSQESPSLKTTLREREPSSLLSSLKEEMRERVEDRWQEEIASDARLAETRNAGDLYPNPGIQAYVNLLGQTLLPEEVSQEIFVSFKIVYDPMPYTDALATGTVFVSTGMLSLLDNESQLAFVLMHEAGHVALSHQLYQIIEEEKAEKKAKRNKILGSIAGAVVGGIAGGQDHLAAGAAMGYLGAEVSGRFRHRHFIKRLQEEADDFATEILLRNDHDIREVPILMAKLQIIVGRSNQAVGLAFAYANDLPDRSGRIVQQLTSIHKATIDSILGGEGFKMTSPRFNQLMSELKRDNGLLALRSDLFAIAKSNLEEAAAIRTDDPVTMYGLGLLYRAVARTSEERSKAANYLKSAIRFDEERHLFPEAYLQYAVELLSLDNPEYYPEVQNALKSYVAFYQRRSGGRLPPEMRFVYDYLSLTGDEAWVAYEVSNVNSDEPYQQLGNPQPDLSR